MIQDSINWSDTLISRVGGSNRYQILLFANFSLKWILAGMILFSLNFFYLTPQFKCTKQQLKVNPNCQEYVCSFEGNEQFWYNHLQTPVPPSISLDYGIIMLCDKKYISSWIQALSYIGSFLGYIIMSHLADNFGRRKVQLLSWIVAIVGLFLLVISGSSLLVVAIGTLLMGMGTNATITLHYTFLKQMIVGKNRQRSIIALQIMFSIGVALVALFSMFIQNWKAIVLFFMLIPALTILPFSLFIVEETLNFSLHQSKNKLLKSLNKIAKINGNQQLIMEDLDFIQSQATVDQSSQNSNKYSLLDLFRYKSLRNITIICALMDLIIQFIYDGTILSLDKIGINIYLDQILVGFVEIFAAIFCSWCVVRVKRKKFTILCMGLAGCFTFLLGILSMFFKHQENQLNAHTISEMVLLGFLRFVLNSVWGIFFVYIAELFPSNITSLSFGWVSAVGTIGASAAPFIRLLTAKATMFVMAILCVLSILMVRKLRETKDQKIPQEIQEKEQQKRKSTISSNEDIP